MWAHCSNRQSEESGFALIVQQHQMVPSHCQTGNKERIAEKWKSEKEILYTFTGSPGKVPERLIHETD